MACGPPGSSVHGILQARILKWEAIPSSRGSSQPKDPTWVSCIAGGFFTTSATWEAAFNKITGFLTVTFHTMFWWAPRLQTQVDIVSLTPKSHLPGRCPHSMSYRHPLIGWLGQPLAWACVGLFPTPLVTQSQNLAGLPIPRPAYSLLQSVCLTLGQVPAVSVVTEVISPPCTPLSRAQENTSKCSVWLYTQLNWPLPPTCSVQLNFKKTISNSSQKKKVKEKENREGEGEGRWQEGRGRKSKERKGKWLSIRLSKNSNPFATVPSTAPYTRLGFRK